MAGTRLPVTLMSALFATHKRVTQIASYVGDMLAFGLQGLSELTNLHNPQCQKATFQVTLRWAQMCLDDSHVSK
eukprot:SAG11_NODE_23585_length_386_cov_0.707317_1_plen_73_part_10